MVRSHDVYAVVLADGSERPIFESVQDPDGECLVRHLFDFFGCGPLETSYLVVGGEPPAFDFATEDECDNSARHILIDAGQRDRFGIKASLFSYLAPESCFYGLAKFEHSSRRFPVPVVPPPDEQGTTGLIGDDPCNAD